MHRDRTGARSVERTLGRGEYRVVDQAQIAIAVDDAFLESDVRGSRLELLKGTPEELMFAMITCCDVIELAEYELSGHRRVISA
jgi:hypothetical protein